MAGVGCLLAASCGGQAAPAGAVFTDGTRLKAIWDQAPGAPKRLLGWYDTVLETPCAFPDAMGWAIDAPAEPELCIPANTAALLSAGAYGPFADASCNQPIAEVNCQQQFVLGQMEGPAGTFALHLFRTGAQVAPENAYVNDTISCVPTTQRPGTNDTWYTLGDEIPLATLVSATIDLPTGGSGPRIQPVWLRASDGASAQVAARDGQRGELVAVPDWGHPNPVIAKWEPVSPASNIATQPFYSDAACSVWVATSVSRGDVSVKSITLFGNQTCQDNREQSHYEVAEELDRQSVYVYENPSCRMATDADVSSSPTTRFFAPGALIPARAFADASVAEQGSDRIRLRQPASADGPVDTGAGEYFDSEIGQACTPLAAADGSLRCLPSGGSTVPDLYADAACTIPLASYPRPSDCGENGPGALASVVQHRSLTYGEEIRYRIYQVAGMHAGGIYWAPGQRLLPEARRPAQVYDVGAELSAGCVRGDCDGRITSRRTS